MTYADFIEKLHNFSHDLELKEPYILHFKGWTGASNSSIMWELANNAEFQVPPETY